MTSFWNSAYMAWINAGGPPNEAAVAASVASAESGSGTNLFNPQDTNGLPSSGAWQINGANWGQWGIPRDGSRFSPLTQDLSTNAQAAVAVWRHQGWGAWGTYNNGAWKHFFPGETPGVSSNALAGLQGREPSGGPSATLAGQAASGGGGSPASRGFAPGAPIVLSAGEISGLVLFIAGILAFAAFGGVAKATS